MKPEESKVEGCASASHKKFWYIAGGAVLSLVAYSVIISLHDIRRYLAIRRM
jgi:hypothetical protein